MPPFLCISAVQLKEKYKMDLEQLLTLKDKLVAAKEFYEPWEYFFDHFGEDPDLYEVGQRKDHNLLKKVIEVVGEQLFKKKVALINLLIVSIPEYHFFHGACFIQGKMTNFLYFEDIDMGLLAVVMGPGKSQTMLVRFSSMLLEGKSRKAFLRASPNN